MSRSSRLLPLALIPLLALACTEDPIGPDRPAPPAPSPDIVDAGHGGEAPGFYFLPPMTGAPSSTGTLDAELAPVVTICEGAVTDCGSPVAEFTKTSGPGSETVRVAVEDEHYVVNWHTDAFGLDPSLTYRIVVSVVPDGASEALVLGYADVAVASTGGELKNTDTGDEVPLKDGRTLPIKFRMETGIVGRLVVAPSEAEIEVDETQQFTATVYDLHGSEITSATATWSSDDEAVATVDGTGFATGKSSGTATITATSQRVSGSAELTVTAAAVISPTEVAKLLARDRAFADEFGVAVDVDRDVAVIGARFDTENGFGSGSAYVYERDADGAWSQMAKLTATDGEMGDRFGSSIAVAGDVAVIGAPFDGGDSGLAYVFERSSDGTWAQVAKLTASGGSFFGHFGWSLALDGDTAVVGEPGGGAVYVFERSSTGSWAQVAKLEPSDRSMGGGQGFGGSVSVSGEVVVIGARFDRDNGSFSGSAYVFEHSEPGGWAQVAKLLANDGVAGDAFGTSVSVSDDVAVIGATGDDDKGSGSGSAYVFEHSEPGGWAQAAKLTASVGGRFDFFGTSVALSGGVAVIGANKNGAEHGSIYVFSSSGGTWTEVTTDLPASDGHADDLFGQSVAAGGGVVVVGAPRSSGTGAAYVFDLRP